MENFISNLCNKPENVRIKILWISVFICMIVIVGIWFIDLRSNIQRNSADTSLKQTVNNLIEDVNIDNVKADVQLNIDNLMGKNNQENNVVENQTDEKVENKVEQGKAYQLPIE